jgi:hypothetical protein
MHSFEATPAADFSLPQVRRAVPAWLLSLAMHLLVLLALSLWLRGELAPPVALEPGRTGQIVLARRSESDQTKYFTPEESPATASEATSAASSSSAATSQNAFNHEPPAASAKIALPQFPGAMPSGSELVVLPRLSAGGGRPVIMPGLDDAAIRAADAKNRHPKRVTGPTTRMSLFGSAEAEGWSFIFVIDRSQSMGGEGLGAIAAAAAELAGACERLTAAQTFQLVAYNQKPDYLTGRELIPATARHKQQMLDYLKTLAAYGATDHNAGLLAALRLEPDVIFLLTDGGDPYLNRLQMRTVREAAAGRTSIHVLQFGAGPPSADNDFLPRLAAENRGSYVYIDVNKR